jgi:hypothetical protein
MEHDNRDDSENPEAVNVAEEPQNWARRHPTAPTL